MAASHSSRVQPLRWISRLQGTRGAGHCVGKNKQGRLGCNRKGAQGQEVHLAHCDIGGRAAQDAVERHKVAGKHGCASSAPVQRTARPVGAEWASSYAARCNRSQAQGRKVDIGGLTGCCWAPHRRQSASTGPGCRPSRRLRRRDKDVHASLRPGWAPVPTRVGLEGCAGKLATWRCAMRSAQRAKALHCT